MYSERFDIPGPLLIVPKKHEDARGYFAETYNRAALAEVGITEPFVQDNQSLSRAFGVVRGLHFQEPPFAQAKLVRCIKGKILDVAVDIRNGSPWFGRHVAVELSSENRAQLFVPAGFAHGFITREPDTEVFYKVSAPYSAAHDRGIRWNDPVLGIDWGLGEMQVHLSEKDQTWPLLGDVVAPFDFSEPSR